MGGADILRGFVLSTLNKIPKVTPDIVATDKKWKNWDIEALINKLWQWLKKTLWQLLKSVRPKREKNWYNNEKGAPVCIFCEGKHW